MTGHPPWWAGLAPLIPETTDPRIATGVAGEPPGQPVSWPAGHGGPRELAPWSPSEQELSRWGDIREVVTTTVANEPVMLADVQRLRVPQALFLSLTLNQVVGTPWTIPINILADLGVGRARQRARLGQFLPAGGPTQTQTFQVAARTIAISVQFNALTVGNPERSFIFAGIGVFGGGLG